MTAVWEAKWLCLGASLQHSSRLYCPLHQALPRRLMTKSLYLQESQCRFKYKCKGEMLIAWFPLSPRLWLCPENPPLGGLASFDRVKSEGLRRLPRLCIRFLNINPTFKIFLASILAFLTKESTCLRTGNYPGDRCLANAIRAQSSALLGVPFQCGGPSLVVA